MKLKDFQNIIEEWHLRIWAGAFFFAAILWLFVISEQIYSYVIELPIEVRNIKEGKTIKWKEEEQTAYVRFQATGRAFLWAFIFNSISEFKLVLDLEQISTDYDFILNDYYKRQSEKIVIPTHFDLEFIEVVRPHSIHIELEDYMIKPVKVVLNITIQPAPQFIQVGPTKISNISDRTVELSGPKDIIRDVDTVETVYLEYFDLQSTLRESVPLNLKFPRSVEASPPTVEIVAEIQEIGERIITEVPVTVLNIPEDIRVFPNPSTVSLTVTGGVDFIAGLEPSDIEVYIDYEKSSRNQQIYYQPTVQVPPSVLQWRDLSPKNIELAIARIRE